MRGSVIFYKRFAGCVCVCMRACGRVLFFFVSSPPSRVCSGSVGGKRDSCVRCFLVVFPSFEIVTNLIKKGKR